jgi:acetaldehyde dehydrogenase/alcohol dehydrogenase
MYKAALASGVPKHAIQWVKHPSVEGSNYLMGHPGVALVLATGGASMVKAAYSSGTPAFGVGPGNTPVYIDKNARIDLAVTSIILSKTFDNGTICASEQSIIIHTDIVDEVEAKFEQNGVYFCSNEEAERLAGVAIDPKRQTHDVSRCSWPIRSEDSKTRRYRGPS